MGTKVQTESYFPGYFSMRDLNEDPNNCGWPGYYGDKNFANGHYFNGFVPKAVAEPYPGYNKDTVKQTMLEHEAVFKDQLYELHRLYRVQRNLMDEAKSKEPHEKQMPVEMSLSSIQLPPQITPEDARRWHQSAFALTDTASGRPSTSSVEENHSPLSSMVGSSAQASPLPIRNGSTSRDVDLLKSRPTKVRRRLLDLQLPADAHTDTEEGEETRGENVSSITNFLSNQDKKIEPKSEMNLFFANGGKNSGEGAASRSELQLKSKPNVADLNEPIDVEETKNSSFVHLLSSVSSCAEANRNKEVPKLNSQLLGFPKVVSLNSHHRTNNGTSNNLHLQNNISGKLWIPHMPGQENIRDTLESSSHYASSEKSRIFGQPMEDLFNKTQEPSARIQSMVDHLREQTACCLKPMGRNHELFNNNHQESIAASSIPNPYPMTISNLGKSWSQSFSSWEKPNNNFGQMPSYLNSSSTLTRSSQSSNQSRGNFGDQWNYNNNSMSKTSFGTEIPNQNGFCCGSSSGSKDTLISPLGNNGYLHNGVSLQFNSRSSAKFYKTPNNRDHGHEIIDLEKENEDHGHALHWLKAKPSCKTERITSSGIDLNMSEVSFMQSTLVHSANSSETGRPSSQVANQDGKLSLNSKVVENCQIGNGDSSGCRKILGFPIFQQPHVSKNDSSSFTAHSTSIPQASEEVEKCGKSSALDINLPSEPASSDLALQAAAGVECFKKETDTKFSSSRLQIDLNCCMSEDEALIMPDAQGCGRKVILEIDLEVPAVPEMDEDVVPNEGHLEKSGEAHSEGSQPRLETAHDELIKMAAETIVVISSSLQNNSDDATFTAPEASMTDPLHWFVEVAFAYGDDLESKFSSISVANVAEPNELPSVEELDSFECMTLNLKDTKEEDYMPKPLVPENLKLEERATNPLSTRTRKGQGRRGRQRRDFQRDILPGLVSLSRHEVTEDIQTFGGLMRATGHSWSSGLTRRSSTRNGSGRGRRRKVISPPPISTPPPPLYTPLIQQVNTIEAGLEDRSLTSWGKTTRRPRRQRCPAGNLSSAPLT